MAKTLSADGPRWRAWPCGKSAAGCMMAAARLLAAAYPWFRAVVNRAAFSGSDVAPTEIRARGPIGASACGIECSP